MSGCLNKIDPYLAWFEKFESGLSQAKVFFSSYKNDFKNIENIYYVGMGGSAAAGSICQDLISKNGQGAEFLTVCDALALPKNTKDNDLFFLVSHSGNTWEVLQAFGQLVEANKKCFVLAGGGQILQRAEGLNQAHCKIDVNNLPRQDLPVFMGYFLGFLLGLGKIKPSFIDWVSASIKQALPGLENIDVYKDFLNMFGSSASCHIFYVSGDCPGVAARVRNQLCENSKVRACITPLTEGLHNKIAAFESGSLEPILIIESGFLGDNVQKSLDCARAILAEKGVGLYRPPILGDNWAERFIWLVVWADFASVYLALQRGQDPDSVALIDRLKSESSGKIKV